MEQDVDSLKNGVNVGRPPIRRPSTDGRPLKNRSGTSTRKRYNPRAISVFVKKMEIGGLDFGLVYESIRSR